MLVFIPQSRGTHQYLEGEFQVQYNRRNTYNDKKNKHLFFNSHHPNRLVEDIGSKPSSQIWKIPAIFFLYSFCLRYK